MFDVAAKNQGSLVQLIQGMQEIKLANAEHLKRWEWERIQTKMFQFQTKGLALNQYQQAGAFFLNEGKNILITFFTAKAVVDGQLTLGTMLKNDFRFYIQLTSYVIHLTSFSFVLD
jgi:ATP-binding cassette subfamily B protein